MNWKMHVSINESTSVIFTCMKELKNMRKSLVLSMKLYGHVLLCPSFLLEAFIPLSQPLLGWAFCDFNSAGVDWIWAGWDRPISDAAGVVNRTHMFEAQLIGNCGPPAWQNNWVMTDELMTSTKLRTLSAVSSPFFWLQQVFFWFRVYHFFSTSRFKQIIISFFILFGSDNSRGKKIK